MTRTSRAEALFVSCLQPSAHPSCDEVEAAIHAAVAAYGLCGCATALAAEYGDHPDTAVDRMRWALALAGAAPAT